MVAVSHYYNNFDFFSSRQSLRTLATLRLVLLMISKTMVSSPWRTYVYSICLHILFKCEDPQVYSDDQITGMRVSFLSIMALV